MAENGHIEEFFKKQLASHEFAFQEEDWLRMERKLEISGLSTNKAFVRSPVRLILIILAGLTAAFILGWMTNELVRKNKIVEFSKDTGSTQKIPGKKTGVTAQQQSSPVSLASPIDHDRLNHQINPDHVPTPPILVRELVSVNSNSSQQLIPEEDHIMLTRMTRVNNVNRLIDNTSHYPDLKNIQTPFSQIPITRTFSRLSIGISIAPDFNSTGFLNQKRFSPVIGGHVTYALSPRWYISARIFYNKKKYRSSADYYHVSDDYWQNRTNGVVPDMITASCKVIDVPVLLSYDFLQKGFFSVRASAGLGSYFLLDEKYAFTFNSNNPGAATEWQTSDDSRVYFSVVNLAMGFSLRTGPRTSMVMEPYLKIPLKQMGWAKVNLSGMGLSLSFNYHF